MPSTILAELQDGESTICLCANGSIVEWPRSTAFVNLGGNGAPSSIPFQFDVDLGFTKFVNSFSIPGSADGQCTLYLTIVSQAISEPDVTCVDWSQLLLPLPWEELRHFISSFSGTGLNPHCDANWSQRFNAPIPLSTVPGVPLYQWSAMWRVIPDCCNGGSLTLTRWNPLGDLPNGGDFWGGLSTAGSANPVTCPDTFPNTVIINFA